MLDTVVLKFFVHPTVEQLRNWISNTWELPNGMASKMYIYKHYIDDSAILQFVYRLPNLRYPEGLFTIQIPSPKVLYGDNIKLIKLGSEMQEVILRVNRFITTIPCVPTVDIGEGILHRIDLSYNHYVDDRVEDYIQALFSLTYPHRETAPYPHKGIQFKSKVATTKFYDKQRESHNNSAKGILRQETTYRKTFYIDRRMGMKNPTLKDMTAEWVRAELQNDLYRLRLNKTIISNRDFASEVLTEQYGRLKGDRLFGHLHARQSKSIEQMMASGIDRQSILRDDKFIEEAGLSLAMTDEKVPLPPLRIELEV